MEGCIACDLLAGRRPCPGGLIDETDRWAVQHCVGPLGVGTLIVKPKRHVVHVWELDEAEAAEFGQAAMFAREEYPDPAAVEDAAERLRAVLAAERG